MSHILSHIVVHVTYPGAANQMQLSVGQGKVEIFSVLLRPLNEKEAFSVDERVYTRYKVRTKLIDH